MGTDARSATHKEPSVSPFTAWSGPLLICRRYIDSERAEPPGVQSSGDKSPPAAASVCPINWWSAASPRRPAPSSPRQHYPATSAPRLPPQRLICSQLRAAVRAGPGRGGQSAIWRRIPYAERLGHGGWCGRRPAGRV